MSLAAAAKTQAGTAPPILTATALSARYGHIHALHGVAGRRAARGARRHPRALRKGETGNAEQSGGGDR